MRWIEVSIDSNGQDIERLGAFLTRVGVDSYIEEDENDFRSFLEKNRQYWDYIDDNLEQEKRGVSRVKFYLSDDETGKNELERIKKELAGDAELSTAAVSCAFVADEDWNENWKQYYKPVNVGRRLIIMPEWEKLPEGTGRAPLWLDPGLLFGTGTHATTRMCLEALEELTKPGARMLDLGCGSGILAIAALILGAESAAGCDIDEKAPQIAGDNAARNGIGQDRFKVFVGDITSSRRLREKIGGGYDIVAANIVADVIIALSPFVKDFLAPGGTFVCSGIIEGRQNEVLAALEGAGMKIEKHSSAEDWHCFISRF
ncbi:MAG: 50S ribosomal protein L11 methyltransferase [Oscillospiraceae bacterium]|nr:50S ribosomal protein L11 methyltransferase [Oscillospiraceae bacterium]